MLAIVIAGAPHEGVIAAAPDAALAGMTLTLRALLTLQQQGATALIAVTSDQQAALLQQEPRIAVPLRCVALNASGEVDWQALAAALDEQLAPSEPFALVRHDWLSSPDGYRALLTLPLADAAAAIARWESGLSAIIATPAQLPELARSRWSSAGIEPADPASAATWKTHSLTARWSADANTSAGRARAVDALFNACRKPVDGLVSRHLNRHVSLWLSRRLVNTRVTPNAMTLVTFAVGLVAAFFATRGGYLNTAIAAVLMQLNSILDGCDGELARVRFQGSKLGQWLDTIGDDISNVIFWTALGFGALHVPDTSWLPNTGVWLARCAWLTALGNGLSAAQYYALLWRLGSGDFYAIQQDDKPPAPGFVGALVRFFSLILKQDFFLFLIMLLALAGLLMWSLPVMAVGALITLASATSRTFKARAANNAKKAPATS